VSAAAAMYHVIDHREWLRSFFDRSSFFLLKLRERKELLFRLFD